MVYDDEIGETGLDQGQDFAQSLAAAERGFVPERVGEAGPRSRVTHQGRNDHRTPASGVTPCITTSHGVTVLLRAAVQVGINPIPPELGMRRVLRLVSIVIPIAALAACASPTAPDASASCAIPGRTNTGTCVNRDFVNPLGDFVNPLGDFVNPLGRDSTRSGE